MILKNYPPQIKYIVGNEAAERYSYYGMRSILVVFMTQQLLMEKGESISAYHTFVGACYLLPLLGAFLSDRFLGKYKTIFYLSLAYCGGHLILALNESRAGLFAGLALIALGSGGIKPCVSAHVGDQFHASEQHKMRKIFDVFYWMVNFGSFFATLITPWTYHRFGAQWAFGVPGILMLIATFVFWMGRKLYVHVPPTGKNPHGFFQILGSAFLSLFSGQGFFAGAERKHDHEAVEGFKSILKLLVIYVWISVFWALYDQSSSTWILQAQKMNLNFLGIEWNESQIQSLNPILILILVPLFSSVIYPTLEKWGIKLTSLRKMTAGLFLAGFAFLSVTICQWMIESGQQISVGYQFWSYLILSMGEILVSVTGLEFAYTQAPRSMKSTIMSFWYLTVFFGNMITAELAHLNFFETASTNYFAFYTALMFVIAVVFSIISKNYKIQTYMEK